MINDFPPFIKGELLYGYIYRYHIYSGNLHFCETAQDIWGDINKWITSILFPLVAKSFIEAIGMSRNEYINEHTVLPFYKLFIDKKKYNLITEEMFTNNRYCLRQLIKGMKINFDDKSIRFCPLCIKENYNLPVLLIEHNIDGVNVCKKHKCILNKKTWGDSRKRDKFSWDEMDREVEYSENSLLLGVAEDVAYILNHEIQIEIYTLRELLRNRFTKSGYIYKNDFQMQQSNQKLRASFNDIPQEYQIWIHYLTFNKFMSEKLPMALHPINYILVIRQLYGSFENFIKEDKITLLS